MQLTDPDGDGVYTGSTTVTNVPSEVRPVDLLQGNGTVPCSDGSGPCPGDPITLIKSFGLVEFGGDQSFSGSVSFSEQYAADQQYAPQGTAGDQPTAETLPDTGGPLLLAPVAGLLLGSGILGLALTRRRTS